MKVGVGMETVRRKRLEFVNNTKMGGVEQGPDLVLQLLIIAGSGISKIFRGGTC